MSDEDALLAAIDAHPAEDTPRLMYADWLDENDRPLRAEFIRLQLTLREPDKLAPEEAQKLRNRQRVLVENHRRDLIGPLGAHITLPDVTFDRGFVAELRVTAFLFLQHADAFAALRPRPRLVLRYLDAIKFEQLLRTPAAEAVTRLSLHLNERSVVLLAGCPYFSRLAEFAGEAIGETGLDALAWSKHIPALTSLNLSGNNISDVGVGRLVASPLWPRLRHLDLSGNQLTDADVLADAPDDRLERLILNDTAFSRAGRGRLKRRFGERVAVT
ncbi:MAG: TIGR02996 domain-containing protein [Gemmataceae bacterium]|nr:TIGR02996 domain-containing protein [Gemmataceae bacterium]